jgi:hypothetical protein
VRFSLKAWRSSRYVAVAIGVSLAAASALAASAPADAAASGGPAMALRFGLPVPGLPMPGLHMPGLRVGPLADRLPTGPSSQLFGVFCTSPANCWAVGETSSKGVERNQVLHWTGKHWFNNPVPNPGGTRGGADNELFAVRCTSASNCWAVGDAEKANSGDQDQALHWNGRKWFAVTTPTPAGVLSGDINFLSDVTCVSASNCWAAGDYGEVMATMTGESEVLLNQVLHWNGKNWSLVPAPNPAGVSSNHASVLDAVRCTSAANCWAAGVFGSVGVLSQATLHNEMLHWNGKKWAKVTVPNPGGLAKGGFNELNGLACASAVNCWAAGLDGNFGVPKVQVRNDILHWNGKKWSKQTAPNPGGGPSLDDALFNITCSSARNCWAVGSQGNFVTGKATLNEALRWDGTKWKSFSTPNPGGAGPDDRSVLSAARCTSAANCWAVGVSEKHNGADKNEILHWTGKKWFVG